MNKIEPYDWQQPSVDSMLNILQSGNVCLNTSDTGTGKTVTALAVLKQLNTKALIVCPKAVHTAWRRTAEAMDCSNLIHGIVNAERLQFKNDYFQDNKWLIPKDMLIIWDEVHRGASGPKSNTTKILALTRPLGYKVLAMSATIANSPLQMRAVGYLAGLHQFKDSSYWRWCVANGCFRKPPIKGYHFPKGPSGRRHMLKIREDLKDVMVRVRKDEIPDFPETTILVNLYDLETDYQKAINDTWNSMRTELSEVRNNPLTERLRAREVTELCKVDLITDLAKAEIEEGNSVVIFVNFRSVKAKLVHSLNEYKPAYIHGNQKNRQEMIDKFQADETPVIVCMSQAGGVGISLHQTAGKRPRVSFITPSDKADDLLQCLGRVNRANGGSSIQTIVLAAGTVEEKIQRNLQGKLRNMEALQDGDLEI